MGDSLAVQSTIGARCGAVRCGARWRGARFRYFERSASPIALKLLDTFHTLMVAILLLNVLIAMMNHTFSTIWSQAHHEWWATRAEFILTVERFHRGAWVKFIESDAQYIHVISKKGNQPENFDLCVAHATEDGSLHEHAKNY